MDNPNITMEEYIRLEEEKALRNVFNDELSSEKTLSCEPTVSSLNNNEINFRISFDESDDEDYTGCETFARHVLICWLWYLRKFASRRNRGNDITGLGTPGPKRQPDLQTVPPETLRCPRMRVLRQFHTMQACQTSSTCKAGPAFRLWLKLAFFGCSLADDEVQDGSGTPSMQLSDLELIMEYLVKIRKKARIMELKRRHLKITVLTSNTPYPSRKIRRICACTSQKTTKETRSIRLIDTLLTMKLPSDRAPSAHRIPTPVVAVDDVVQKKKRKQVAGETSSPRKSFKVAIKQKKPSITLIPPPSDDRERDEIAEETLQSLTMHKTALAAKAQENVAKTEVHIPGALQRICRRQGFMIKQIEKKFVTNREFHSIKENVDKVLHEIIPQIASNATNDIIEDNLSRVIF
ncbi:hypothetical protein Tco_1185134 [Tanacetum coccineum]